MADIKDKKDIKAFVDAFYDEVRKDPVIGGVFASRIENDNWPVHLERMYSFWNTVLFHHQDYRGNPFAKHADLPIESKHFERWISLFNKTIDNSYKGAKATEAKDRAFKMGQLFNSKIEHIRANKNYINLM